ncbi:MAG: cold shock domain-containing protein [Deltaproteobacteria bacterium]|nr:cold shock domain-containing protein [Deltaproteobacteria bacterium]
MKKIIAIIIFGILIGCNDSSSTKPSTESQDNRSNSKKARGEVKLLDVKKGLGIIQKKDGGDNVYFNISSIVEEGLKHGDSVEFDIIEVGKKLHAKNVRQLVGDHFGFLIVVVGIIIGLGITKVLSGTSHIIRERKRIEMYWVHFVWIFIVFTLQVHYWYKVASWGKFGANFFGYMAVLIYPILLYMFCVLLFPRIPDQADQEIFKIKKYYFYQQRCLFILATLAMIAISVQISLSLKESINFYMRCTILCPGIVLPLGLIFTKNEKFHAISSVISIVFVFSYICLYSFKYVS